VSRIVTRGQCACPSFAARSPSVCAASRCGANLIERPPCCGHDPPVAGPGGVLVGTQDLYLVQPRDQRVTELM